jgi:Cysteine-rich secretory protein family
VVVCLLSGWLAASCGGGTIQGPGTATGAAGTSGAAGSSGAAGMHGAAGTTGAAGSGTTTGAAGTGAADPYVAARQACVDKINMFRATLSLAALTPWTAEDTCTDGEAKSDSVSGTAHGAFGTCTESAQDECPGWGSVDSIAGGTKSCLDQMWAEGPGTDFSTHGHYINMSNPKYTKVACGYAVTPAGKVWAAQDFR